MPKGSKKRKATKKKAHHHHHPNHHHDDASQSSHNNTYGDEDLKQHEDKESDSESANSPTSQDNPNSQLDLTDGEKEERKKVDDRTLSSSEDGQSVDESKVHPEVVPIADEEGGVHVDQELEVADQSNGKTENVEIVPTDSDLFQRPDEGCADSDVIGADELKGDNSTAMIVEPIKESGNVYLEKSSSDEALVIEKTAVPVEDSPLINPDDAVSPLSEVAPSSNGEKSSVIEVNGSVSEVDEVALPNEKTNGDDIASAASVIIPDVTVPGIENKEKEAILLDKNYLTSDPVNLASENRGDEVVVKTDVALSDSNLSASPLITEENVMLTKIAPITESGNHVDFMDRSVEQKDDIEVSEASISQPLLAARPQPRTSWMSCCGLFEAFSGSAR